MKNKGKRAKRHHFCSYYSITFSTIHIYTWLVIVVFTVTRVRSSFLMTNNKNSPTELMKEKKEADNKAYFSNFFVFSFQSNVAQANKVIHNHDNQ